MSDLVSGLQTNPVLMAGFIVVLVFFPLSFLVTGMRFWATKLAKRSLAAEDWFALGALIAFILWVIFLAMMAMNVKPEPTYEDEAASNRMLWASTLTFPINQLCSKLSILLLYQRIFGINPTYSLWIKIIAVIQILHTIENIFVDIFTCVPVQKFWRPDLQGRCIEYVPFLVVNESVNSLIDFVMAIQAVIMLRSLKTARRTKWQLSVIFAIGGLAGVIGFVKIGVSVANGVAVENQYLMGVWATVQMALSIFCCCVVTFRPITLKFGQMTRKLTSKATSTNLTTKKSTGTGQLSTSATRTNQSDAWINLESGPGGATHHPPYYNREDNSDDFPHHIKNYQFGWPKPENGR
ncbi:unnamed protein product [Clonostachys chloroleuca]|uniref:Rhodopsin domain-containing protein n=1 Tax=Clonostachys chloroleuca TaxID=1926264 RepID=A0AA35LUN6_9HYPO|nr:unnamed protein product [Clonostachys chloroleuca]